MSFSLRTACFALLLVGAELGPSRADSLPQQMRFCGLACFTLTLADGKYNAVRENDPLAKVISTYEVKHFDRDNVVIRRHDIASGAEARLTGQISNTGNFVVNAMMTWDSGGVSGPYELSWGDALALAKPPAQERGTGAVAVNENAYRKLIDAPPVPASQLNALPRQLLDCEANVCNGYWTFDGGQGKSIWPSTEVVGSLSVKQFESGKITIVGVPKEEPQIALYTGTINGDTITGTVSRGNFVGPWRATAMRTPRFDLNGIWRVEASNQNAVRISQVGDRLTMTMVSPHINSKTGIVPASAPKFTPVVIAEATYQGGQINGEYRKTSESNLGAFTWYLFDPDSIGFYTKGISGHTVMYRSSPPDIDQPKCDDSNSSDVSGAFALVRGEMALHSHRYGLAECWIRAGATKGDGRAAATLAAIYFKGYPGIHQDYAKAANWAQISHHQDNYEGEFLLSYLYAKGLGVPQSTSQAQFWYNTAQADTLMNPYQLSGRELQQYEGSKELAGIAAFAQALLEKTEEDCNPRYEHFNDETKQCDYGSP